MSNASTLARLGARRIPPIRSRLVDQERLRFFVKLSVGGADWRVLPDGLPQRSIWLRPFASRRGGTSANFGRQAPRAPTDFGRHGALHDDRDGPAWEPPEDAPSGESEGRDVRRDGGGEARRHGGPRAPCERLPPRSGVWGGG